MPAFYRKSIQNAVNQQINISKSKHRTMLNLTILPHGL